jgi:hypothetical protein
VTKRLLAAGALVALVGILLASGVSKLMDPEGRHGAHGLAAIGEVALACGLASRWRVAALWLLLGAFGGAAAVNLGLILTGQVPASADCGCFGNALAASRSVALAIQGVVLLVTALMLSCCVDDEERLVFTGQASSNCVPDKRS